MEDDTVAAKAVIWVRLNGLRTAAISSVMTHAGTGKSQAELVRILSASWRCIVAANARLSVVPRVLGGHPTQDVTKTDVLALLLHMRQAQNWPRAKHIFKEVVGSVMGDARCADILLADMLHFGYADFSFERGTRLSWNVDRIEELATRLKKNTGVEPSLVQASHPHVWKKSDGMTCIYVSTEEKVDEVVRSNQFLSGQFTDMVTLDCKGAPNSLELVQVCRQSQVFIFDGQLIGSKVLCEALAPLLTSTAVVKVLHDARCAAQIFFREGDLHLSNVLDTQLLNELCCGQFNADLYRFLENAGVHPHPPTNVEKPQQKWTDRPLNKEQLERAAADVSLLSLIEIKDVDSEAVAKLQEASHARCQNALSYGAAAYVCFDSARKYRIMSAELLRSTRPQDGIFGVVVEVQDEVDQVMQLLPEAFKEKFEANEACPGQTGIDLSGVRDIDLDIGCEPQCWVSGKRIFLCHNRSTLVTEEHVESIIKSLGKIGHDNRAGLTGRGSLHRFSVMRDRDNEITGLTIRIGRNIHGLADLMMDCILGSEKSILFLGEPGSGKTTVVREVTRILAENHRVIVVDTSNEIGGDGKQPHGCIGLARRMMVKSLDAQSQVMIECVQNHTPSCMVIDEIGRPKEVDAARTVRQRGVRIIASAHGDLRKLVKNKELNGLVGGVETVTMGDGMARQEAKRRRIGEPQGRVDGMNGEKDASAPFGFVNKNKTVRRGEPTFDIVVELKSGGHNDWIFVPDVAKAVDDILDGREYQTERRSRDPDTSAIMLAYSTG